DIFRTACVIPADRSAIGTVGPVNGYRTAVYTWSAGAVRRADGPYIDASAQVAFNVATSGAAIVAVVVDYIRVIYDRCAIINYPVAVPPVSVYGAVIDATGGYEHPKA